MTAAPPQPSPAGLAYDLSAWGDDPRRSLDSLLRGSGIEHRWQPDGILVVPAAARPAVDRHLSSLTGGGPSAAPSSVPVVAPPPPVAPPPGWYEDPWRLHPLRWWDGRAWTGHTGPPPPERPWLPPRHPPDDTPGMRGGGLALAGIVGGFALGLGLGYLALALGVARGSATILVVSQLGLWAGLLSACVVAVRRHGSRSLRDLGLARLRWRDVGPGLLGAWVGRVASIVLIAPLIPLLPQRTVRTNGFTTDLHRDLPTVVIAVLFVTVGAPLVEELFFRGLVQSVFTRRWGARVAVFAQAACFGVVHYQYGMTGWDFLVTFIAIASTGILLGVLRWHYQRLGPGMVAHAAFNAVAVILVLALT